MANRKNTFLIKRSNVAGKVPAAGDLQLGELALNTADNILYASGTTANSILPIGWDRVARTGDTMTGSLFAPSISATTISATTYLNLPSMAGDYLPLSGGTVYGPTIYTGGLTANTLNVTGLTQTSGITSTGGITFKQVTINSSYTATTSDYMIDVTGGTFTVSLPSAVGIQGRLLVIKNNGGGAVTVDPYGSETIDGKSFIILGETNSIQLASNGTEWVALGYNISTVNSSTGVFEFTGLTKVTSTTFRVAEVKGWIVDDTTNPLSPQLYYIYYSGGVHTDNYVTTANETFVYLTSGGTIGQQSTPLTTTQRRQNIFLGKLGHPDKTTINLVFSQPDFVLSPLAQLRDMFQPINLINGGVYPSPNTGLTINTNAGYIYGLGINFASDTLNPNSLYIPGTNPLTFQYRTQTGGTITNRTNIDPLNYDLNGVITPIGGTKATNQRIYLLQNGTFRVQYGQHEYVNFADAVQALQTETFTPFPNFVNNAVLIGVLTLLSTATDLTDESKAKFFFASKFGETIGAAGGVSTTTLQQAYNNSTNPEIVINATLDGLSIQNGTGNADNTTHLLEGLNTAGNTTSFIRADGYISGTTFQSNGFIANNNGISATTVSATTYLNLPIDVRVTGATYSNNTFTYRNNTGGTFNVLFNTLTGLTVNGNVVVTGTTTVGGTNDGLTKLYVNTTTLNTGIKAYGVSTGILGAASGVVGGVGVSGVGNGGIGVYGQTTSNASDYPGVWGASVGDANTNIGVYGSATAAEGGNPINIGGFFYAADSVAGTNYSVKLQDGTEGINKVLVSQTVDGKANWSSSLSGLTSVIATTISATTYYNLPIDIRVTGGTYAAGTATFTNNAGGTFNVTGFNTGGSTGLTASDYVVQGRLSVDQTIPNSSDTLIAFIDDYDPQNWWDPTSKRFTPNVAGYYIIDGSVWMESSTGTTGQANFQARINGNTFAIIQNPNNNQTGQSFAFTKIMYLNGSTDYVDFTFYQNTGVARNILYGTAQGSGTWFSASLLSGLNSSSFTASNLSGGTGIFAQKSGVDFQFKSLTSTGGTVTISNTSNTVNIEVVPASNFTGGTVSGATIFTNGLTANTFSATTYLNLPTDIRVTGATYSNNTFTYTNNTGGTFNTLFNTVTGLTVNGNLTVTGDTQSWFSGNSSSDLVRITQTGSGNALVVEDANNPDSSPFVVNPSGNVGIGTTTPAAKFEIKSAAQNNLGGLLLRAAASANYPALIYETTNQSGVLELYSGSTLTTQLYANGFSFFNGGNVGIGTTTPTAKLHINHTGSGNSFLVEDSTNPDSTPFVIDNNGIVGVGTTSPSGFNARLVVIGTTVGEYGVRSTGNLNHGMLGNASLGYAGVYGLNSNDGSGTGIGVYGRAEFADTPSSGQVWIGGKFEAAGDPVGASYSVQLLDGTEGINKVLVSQTTDGKANWSSTLSGLTGVYTNTISATTYLNLPLDITVTGGTYSTGTATFRNNTGGTFSVTGFNTGTTNGNGTTNYLTKWTGTTGLGNSQIQDDGSYVSIGASPSSTAKFLIFATGNLTYGLWVRNPSNTSGGYGIRVSSDSGIGNQIGLFSYAEGHPTTGTSIGVDCGVTNGLLGIGVRGTVGLSESGYMGTGIGGYFDGRGDGANGYPITSYSVQLLDGTEGINKVLVSKTVDGKANWSSDLTGLTSVNATTVSATTLIGDGSQITNIPNSVPYGIISAIASGNYLI